MAIDRQRLGVLLIWLSGLGVGGIFGFALALGLVRRGFM